MVLSASQAQTFTNNAISDQNDTEVQQEVSLAEQAIRNAGNQQRFELAYNAFIIGNPIDDPQDDDNLTANQIAFRDEFVNAGFVVGLEEDSGFWFISWQPVGAEGQVNVYSIRTTLTPGAVETQTITAIDNYFEGLTPIVRSRSVLVSPTGSGGDVDETEFGATASVFYEYIAVVDQPNTTDHSTALRSALVASGLGYVDTPTNVFVYKVA